MHAKRDSRTMVLQRGVVRNEPMANSEAKKEWIRETPAVAAVRDGACWGKA